jgi:hypothetical protein
MTNHACTYDALTVGGPFQFTSCIYIGMMYNALQPYHRNSSMLVAKRIIFSPKA